MNERQAKLLEAIIEQFIHTALPVGSKRLLETTKLSVSPATIRAEMAALEDEGFLVQPHVSAGRIPTAKGYRMFVRDFLQSQNHEIAVRKKFDTFREHYLQKKDQDHVYDVVSILARMIQNVTFATVPHRDRVYYLGLANVLKQPEFTQDPRLASGVVEVLENNLTELLPELLIDDTVRCYIGEENILPEIQSCSLIVKRYAVRGTEGVLGVLGPQRMDYGFNTVALDMATELLEQ